MSVHSSTPHSLEAFLIQLPCCQSDCGLGEIAETESSQNDAHAYTVHTGKIALPSGQAIVEMPQSKTHLPVFSSSGASDVWPRVLLV